VEASKVMMRRVSLMMLVAAGCTNEPSGGDLVLRFEHRMDEAAMRLGERYETSHGQTVAFDHVRYWVSNVVLEGDETFEVPDSYYLVEQTPDDERLEVTVPAAEGRYDTLVFHIGVDPGPNASLDLMAGDLRPGIGMDWDWDTGYKFFRTEGSFEEGDTEGRFSFHTGNDDLYRRLSVDLPLEVVLDESQGVTVHADLERVFAELELAEQSTVLGGPLAEQITENLAGMFSVETPSGMVPMTASAPSTAHADSRGERRSENLR
jgi:hypothetical protein